MGFGDFCMTPTDNTLLIFEDSASYDTMNYYFTCTGVNPVAGYEDPGAI